MEDFQHTLVANGLHDLGWNGQKFTWCNCHEGNNFTKKRLDRALVNQAWFEQIGRTRVKVMTAGRSEHLPIFLSFSKQRQSGQRIRLLIQFKAS